MKKKVKTLEAELNVRKEEDQKLELENKSKVEFESRQSGIKFSCCRATNQVKFVDKAAFLEHYSKLLDPAKPTRTPEGKPLIPACPTC